MKLINFIKNLIFKNDLEFKTTLWETENCFKCGNPYDKNSFWADFQEIGGKVYQVPVCNKCSEVNCKQEKPSLED